MVLALITLAIIAVTVGFFIYGTIGLAKFAFRLGGGPGVMCLLFPPYTFYFAFFKLEEEEKDFPTAAWLFGLLTTALLIGVFWAPLSKVVTGDFASLDAGGAGAAVEEFSVDDPTVATDNRDERAADEAEEKEETAPESSENNPAEGDTPAGEEATDEEGAADPAAGAESPEEGEADEGTEAPAQE